MVVAPKYTKGSAVCPTRQLKMHNCLPLTFISMREKALETRGCQPKHLSGKNFCLIFKLLANREDRQVTMSSEKGSETI